MVECDKCGSQIRDSKYPWYSYYAPDGGATTILFRYCEQSKIELQNLYGIPDDSFGRAVSNTEEEENKKEYQGSRNNENILPRLPNIPKFN